MKSYRVSGTLVYFIPVVREVQAEDERDAEILFEYWANKQTVEGPDAENFAPGINDEAAELTYLEIPSDGIVIDYVEEDQDDR